MIDLYTYTTPNGRKPAILLEELGLPYAIHKIDIGKGDQFTPEYVAINSNSKNIATYPWIIATATPYLDNYPYINRWVSTL